MMHRGNISLTLPAGTEPPASLFKVTSDFDRHLRAGALEAHTTLPTGFSPLDEYIGQGLAPESLLLIGGPSNIGKTIFALQMARNIALLSANRAQLARSREQTASGRASGEGKAPGRIGALYVCYEHGPVYLEQRLICMESFVVNPPAKEGVTMNEIQREMNSPLEPERALEEGLDKVLSRLPKAREAYERINHYWEYLYLVKGDPRKTTPEVFDKYVEYVKADGHLDSVVLFVDYLQKVPVMPHLHEHKDPVQVVVEELKNLALSRRIPIVAVAAGDKEGLRRDRLRFEDLWGNSSINYEPDVAIMLNPTWRENTAARRKHREPQVLFSIEKNRLGPTWIEFLFTLYGKFYAFDPIGRLNEV